MLATLRFAIAKLLKSPDFATEARMTGVDATISARREAWHGFHACAPALPEAQAAITDSATFVGASALVVTA